jgi:1-acyl-sn-glycerol-3-phosphate acyltransferase
MQTPQSLPPKPVSEVWRPDLTRLPRLSPWRRVFRLVMLAALRSISFFFLKPTMRGLENLPKRGPALIVINHLGEADIALLAAALPVVPDAIGKIELYYLRILGRLSDWYGIIWLHRGRADRRALRAALAALEESRVLVIAPEGRYTRMGGLEPAGNGAAFLALQTGAPIVPVAMTGTENSNVYPNMRRLRRTPVTLTAGAPFCLRAGSDRQRDLETGTERIMQALAGLLPVEYRGVYQSS